MMESFMYVLLAALIAVVGWLAIGATIAMR
jgi:hypothetical protein